MVVGDSIAIARREFVLSLDKMYLIFILSWGEIKVRYARSVIGPIWLVLATAISAFGLGYIWSVIFGQDKATFIPQLCIGIVIWQFLSACVLDASNCFVSNSAIIKNTLNPLLIFPVVTVLRNLIIFAHNFLIILLVLCMYPPEVNANMLLFIPGLLLVVANLFCWVFILGVLGARFRDLYPAISSFMTIVFFLTPVMYRPERLGVEQYLVWLNPFTYLISLLRDPLSGNASPLFVYIVMITTLLLGILVTARLLGRYKYRIVYWL